MGKKSILILCIIFIFISTLSACGQRKAVPALDSNIDDKPTLYAFVKPGEKEEYFIDDVILVYEEDEKSIKKYELSEVNFFDIYAIVNEKEEWVPFKTNDKTVYKLKNYLDEKGESGMKGEVSPEAFKEQFKYTQYGWLLTEISIEDGYITEVKEIDGSEIRLKYIKEIESTAENNGGNYVKYKDFIYYREGNDDSYEKSGLWDDFGFIKGSESKMMKLNPDGTSEVVFIDNGFGRIFIYKDEKGNPRLFLTGYIEDLEDDQFLYSNVYSVTLDGTDIINYGSGNVFAIDEERGLAMIAGYRGGISTVNLNSRERFDFAEAYYRPIYYDPYDGIIYCEDASGEISDEDIIICSFHISDGVKTILYSATRDDIDEMLNDDYSGDYFETISIKTSDKYVWIYLAGYGGSAYHYYNSALLKINKDGSYHNIVSSPIEIDWFGDKKPFSYEEDTPFYSERKGYYISGLKDKIYPEIILTDNDFKEINLRDGEYFGEDDFVTIGNIEYVDSNIFFTVLTGIRNEEEDVGWRYGYNRGETRVYRKNIETNRIDLLYFY